VHKNIRREGRLVFPALAIIVSAIIWLELILLIEKEEDIERRNARLVTNELADTYEAQMLRVFEQIEQTFSVIQYAAKKSAKNTIIDELSSNSLLPLSQNIRIAILNADGTLHEASSALRYFPTLSDLMPYSHDYILDTDFLISAIPSKSVLQFRRPLIHLGSKDHGFTIIEADASLFVRGHYSANLGKYDKLGLITEDGKFLVKKVGNTISLGEKIDLTEFTDALNTADTAPRLQTSSSDDIERYVSIRTLATPNFPLLTVSGLSVNELLSPLQQRVESYYWSAFLANILILILMGMLWRLNRRLYSSAARITTERARSNAMNEANSHLEKRVERRTQELVLANTRLRDEFKVREKLETDLRLAQKLEAVGRLASGIAHEINTPAQYVGDNIVFLQSAVADITTILQQHAALIEKCRGIPELKAEIAKLQEIQEKLDLDYLVEDMPEAISQALEGIQRISSIVRAMKEFSHPGGAEKEPVDLNRLIDSTVTVARNEWKYVADIDFDLAESLPAIPGFSGELKQTVLNLIVNAAHAIEENLAENSEGPKGKITISTRIDNDRALIRISDTGKGISEQHLDKIFEPFFTTKAEGKGSGQGLAIAYAVVVEKHGGNLDVESTPGVGTCFVISLPAYPEENAQEIA
jgi:signal transduction histidine kinase